MKITGIEPLVVGTFHRNARRHWLLFKLLTDEPGLFGLGEASLHDYDEQIIGILRDWVERYLAGQDPMHHELHWMRLHQDTWARGGALGSTALSGIDIALWDLRGKILNRPVYELLGGPVRREIRVYANGWYTNPGRPEQNGAEAREVVERGFDAMKFDCFGRVAYQTISPQEAQLAEERVAAVREAVGPYVDILVEGHARFNVHTAIHLGQRLAPYRPFWFEEPVSQENVSEMAQVRRQVRIPIATGERLFTKFPFYELIKQEAVDILQPDICNAGGITELKKIAAIAEAQHLALAPHNTNSPIGTVASFHLAAAIPNFLIQEYHAEFYEPWFFDLCPDQPRRTGSHVPLPAGPGLGITLDEAVARAHPLEGRRSWSQRGI
ncbi:MAG TPA: mandelate racemase/muconate lactonizing enzyme family protein [Chloroflexota bacterium]|jgi:galactonate dehydratase|nr:mandelate racemase/muconate lactonizing enzyme family protein [Chloroflexota bacterium]